jgi:PEP-CTERM motif
MRTTFTLSLFVLAAASLLSVPAYADTVTLTLTNPIQFGGGSLGSSLSFDATVTAPSTNSAEVFLNEDSFNVDAPLTLDDDGFFFGFPLSLNPGDSFTGLLFTIFIPTSTPNAVFNGSFSILGGPNGASANDLADVQFEVNTVPEPATILMLGTGLPGLVAAIRRKRGATS